MPESYHPGDDHLFFPSKHPQAYYEPLPIDKCHRAYGLNDLWVGSSHIPDTHKSQALPSDICNPPHASAKDPFCACATDIRDTQDERPKGNMLEDCSTQDRLLTRLLCHTTLEAKTESSD